MFLFQISVPVAVLHVVGLLVRTVDGAGNPGVAPRPPAEELKTVQTTQYLNLKEIYFVLYHTGCPIRTVKTDPLGW